MAKSLRTVIDLGKGSGVSEEDAAKLNINHSKSAAAGTGFARSIRVQDSQETRSAAPVVTPSETPSEPQSEEPAGEEARTVDDNAAEAPAASTIDTEVLAGLIQSAVERNIAPLQEQLAAASTDNESLRAQLEDANGRLQTAESANKAVDDLALLLGRAAVPQSGAEASAPMANFNTLTSPNSDALSGMLAEYTQERSRQTTQYRRTPKGGKIPIFDPRATDRFARENDWDVPYSKGWKTLMNELTELGKRQGFFQGGGLITEDAARAATTADSIPPAFLETLSSLMRVSDRPGLIFHQFTKVVHRFDRGMGDRVDIARAGYPDTLSDSNDRLLSGPNTYVPIDNQNTQVNTGYVQLILNEYGRGGPKAAPIAIPTFVEAFSMIDLLSIMTRDLFRDYYYFEDLIIREQWKPTTAVYYPNGAEGELVTAATDVTAGGVCNREFLSCLYTEAHEKQWLPLPDQCYGAVLVPYQLKQLKDSLKDEWEPPTERDVQALTNILMAQYPMSENIQISGYHGKWENVHIWSTNAFGTDKLNTTADYDLPGREGSALEVDGNTNNTLFHQGYFFGGDTIACGMGGSGPQILYDEKTDFGRIQRAIWHAYEAHGPLDVDPVGYGDNSDIPQQLRVAKIRTARTAV